MTATQKVAAKIRGEMAVQGKTVRELAQLLGVTMQTASLKKNARPKSIITVDELAAIAAWLNLDPADFFTK